MCVYVCVCLFNLSINSLNSNLNISLLIYDLFLYLCVHLHYFVYCSFCGVYGSTGGKRYDVRSSLQQFKDIMDEGNYIVDRLFIKTVIHFLSFKQISILSFVFLFVNLFIYLLIYLFIYLFSFVI